MELTSLDLSVLEDEFAHLEGGFVQKVYQRGEELTLEIYVPGEDKERLIIGTDHAFLSKYKRDNPERPPGFAMELRKHMGKVDSIGQRKFDRILEIESGEKTLVAEIFGKGNFILLDGDKIIGALREEEWADRTIRVGETYSYPEPANDPREKDLETIEDGELVRELASTLSLGGKYAEEICERSGIDKHSEISEMSEKEFEDVQEALEDVLNDAEEPEPRLYTKDGTPEDAAPFKMQNIELDFEETENFSKALDEYYYRRQKREKEEKKQEKYQEQREGLERQLEQQERKKQGLEKSSEQNRRKAELIYENYQSLQQMKSDLEDAVEEHGWKIVKDKIRDAEEADAVKSVNEREEFFSIEVEDMNIKLQPGENLEAAASRYYDKAKDSESKIESVEEAIKRTQEKIDDLEMEDVEHNEMEDKSSKRSKKWFEKYRWFYTSEGFLVVAGRDAQTNDMLVKKHLESEDLYFHADFDGAPSVALKEGKEADEKTREEAAKAAVTFSKTWKAGIGADDVYFVEPDQVTQNPESGEYLGKGAFVIRGDREYMRNMSVEAWIGPYEIDDVWVPMVGPENAVKENCPEALELEPGRTKKSELAKEIQDRLSDYELDLDYIVRALPPGESDLA